MTLEKFRKRIALSIIVVLTFIVMFGIISVTNTFAQDSTHSETTEISTNKAEVMKFVVIAAAIAFGFGALGAGIAIANVGAAAMGAIGEKPEIAGQALIFIALAEGLVVFGFITALMILGKA